MELVGCDWPALSVRATKLRFFKCLRHWRIHIEGQMLTHAIVQVVATRLLHATLWIFGFSLLLLVGL